MDFITQLFTMLMGAATLAITHPFEGGIIAWLSTSFIVFVIFPCSLSLPWIFFQADPPHELRIDVRTRWWFDHCIALPLAMLWRGMRWLMRQGAALAWQGLVALVRFVRYGIDGPPPRNRLPPPPGAPPARP
jgi:hypothetical protein